MDTFYLLEYFFEGLLKIIGVLAILVSIGVIVGVSAEKIRDTLSLKIIPSTLLSILFWIIFVLFCIAIGYYV